MVDADFRDDEAGLIVSDQPVADPDCTHGKLLGMVRLTGVPQRGPSPEFYLCRRLDGQSSAVRRIKLTDSTSGRYSSVTPAAIHQRIVPPNRRSCVRRGCGPPGCEQYLSKGREEQYQRG